MGAILFLIGEAVFGDKIKGGKRLVLFAVGATLAALGVTIFQVFHFRLESWLPMVFGALFLIGGVAFALMSIRAPNHTIDKCFKGIWKGF